VVQFGDIYRLVSPYDKKGVASLMYVNEEKTKSVFFWWKTESFQNEHLPRVKMAGLDAKKMYKVRELNRIDLQPLEFEGKSFSGEYLMNNGLEIPRSNNPEWSMRSDWSSRVLCLEAE
jgi:alpha-galactosidase